MSIKRGKLAFLPKVRRVLSGRRARAIFIILALLVLAFVLSGCTYPGENTVCGTNGAGCTPPDGEIKNSSVGGGWWLDWFFDILCKFMANIAAMAVNLSINLFWTVFAHLGSTNFATGSTDTGMQARLTAVNAAESVVRLAALVCIPPLFVWNTFRGQTIGAIIDTFRESWITTLGRLGGAIGGIIFLPQLVTFFFGLSNELFGFIAGDPAEFNALTQNLMQSADHLTDSIKNPGLMFELFSVFNLMALVWLLLAVAFFVRTIEVYLLFVIGPLALVAGMSDEFAVWFKRWFLNMTGLFVAPLLVAAALRLVSAFGNMAVLQAGPVSSGDTVKVSNIGAYILQIIYIIAFLGVAAYLMFFLAGKTGQVAFGFAKAAFTGLVAGGAAGSAIARKSEPEAKEPPNGSVRVSEPAHSQIGGGGAAAGLLAGGEQSRQLAMDMRGLREGLYSLNAPAAPPQLPPGRGMWGTPTNGGDGGAPMGGGGGGGGGYSPSDSGGAGVYEAEWRELPGAPVAALPAPMLRASVPIPRRVADPFGRSPSPRQEYSDE